MADKPKQNRFAKFILGAAYLVAILLTIVVGFFFLMLWIQSFVLLFQFFNAEHNWLGGLIAFLIGIFIALPVLFILGLVIFGFLFFLVSIVESMTGQKQEDQKKKIALLLKKKPLLEQSKKEVIKIASNKSDNPLPVTASKFGGIPYFPRNADYPLDYDGKKMCFLAQINLSEVPETALLPKTGLLQFFVHGPDVAWKDGIDVTDFGKIGKVLYWETFTGLQLETDPGFYPHITGAKEFVLRSEHVLTFTRTDEAISMFDYRFDQTIQSKTFLEKIDGDIEIIKKYPDLLNEGQGHKLLGYPSFTQWDIRDDKKVRKIETDADQFILLFQMDSEFMGTGDIMWGDMGVANFFIRESDLKNKDFSHVLYSWDCS